MKNSPNAVPLVSLEGIQVRYTNPQGEQFMALASVNLKIEIGDYIAVLGPSGSGKSSLSNIIGMLSHRFEGSYSLNGQDVSHLKDRERVQIRSEKFGFVFQDYVLLDHLTALENVCLALRYSSLSKKEIRRRARDKLVLVGLSDKLDHLPMQLSGGQKQRVGIARALIKDPDILIADEPTGALDHVSRVEILSLLQDLNEQGVTIVTVTHSEADAQAAKRIVRVEKGKIVSDTVQRAWVRFFGRNIDPNDKAQVATRAQMVFNYLTFQYGLASPSDFLNLDEGDLDSQKRLSVLFQLRSEWLNDSLFAEHLNRWFESSDEVCKLVIAQKVFQAGLKGIGSPSLMQKVEDFFSHAWQKEASMVFLKELKEFPVLELRKRLRSSFFFSHESPEVRATAVNLVHTDLLSHTDRAVWLRTSLSDKDSRVRSNTLDFLFNEKEFEFGELRSWELEKDSSPRVRAVWSEILIRQGLRSEANTLLQAMLLTADRSEILAAIWVLAKDHDFDLSQFLTTMVPKNPALLIYIDDILSTHARARSVMEDWRSLHHAFVVAEDKAA